MNGWVSRFRAHLTDPALLRACAHGKRRQGSLPATTADHAPGSALILENPPAPSPLISQRFMPADLKSLAISPMDPGTVQAALKAARID